MLFASLIAILLRTAQLDIHDTQITVEIADTAPSRARGLMNRESLPEGRGMLFVYDKPGKLSFWMKNTKIPLSVGFFDEEKRLIQIEDMDPPKTNTVPPRTYTSKAPAQYALEVPQHWFQQHKIPYGAKFALHDLSQ